ncbi:MAG: EAL domain-containing protein [Phenylobacterium sp.]|jgi:cyclic-di-GMP phosphodiesterase TipF (flagellum assembly factor)|uniref:flagella assembly cyclic-di-GMP phosphodiesterase TipF n=1 Tax=Phenylobacterium sp. TaxID=1871053 RepID=UPI001B3E93C8|nr:EAL domain-containing protein [Phenylobacterium sp.]MBP7648877.1 EAL domain-containing protein [Phenylobacterium sp.]MBP7816218.1 EAL domain-containing protein [Phenylobacterium sp.]MBP9230268.1 EAL domain-containing protein [Phenylobacterium sp.]MBP9754432.1 EAL domain-containing protein [Phenylobacterium sp.]
MRRLTLALLSGAYLCVALIFALLLWRNGGGWAAGLSMLAAGFALCYTFHGLIMHSLENAALRRELENIREAQRILIDQMERMDARVVEVVDTVTDDAARRSEELTGEVHMLEDLVQRMGQRLEERMVQAPPLSARHAPQHRQSAALLETIREALAENRVDLYLQPVVGLPQRRTVFYESFSRLRDETGRVMMPAEYLAVAEPEGLVTSIDNLLLFRCVQIVRRLAKTDKKIGIFCNISTSSLADESFFPQFLDLLAANRDLAGALIFELGQAAFDARGAVEARNMGKLADLGFRFSLDKVVDLDLDFQDLARSDVKFLKIGASFLLNQLVETDEGLVLKSMPDLAAQDFATLTRRYGVEIIAEKVEEERQIVDILELDIAYGQGHLFGEPRPIKDAVLAETDPPAEFLRTNMRRRAGGRH